MSIAVLDFGGQYTHLLAQRVRKLNVYSVILNPQTPTEELDKYNGIILSGGPHSTNTHNAPLYNPQIFNLQVPVLGICYGHQLLCKYFGARIVPGLTTEYGPARLSGQGEILGVINNQQVWMSHSDTVTEVPDTLQVCASTEHCAVAAVENTSKKVYGVQFHPEVQHTEPGERILENFINVCKCPKEWSIQNYTENLIQELQRKCVDKSVFMLLSGGVDSTVAFTLLTRALGPQRVVGLHIDNGFMRYKESEQVLAALADLGIKNIHTVNASNEFYNALHEIIDPQEKRRIIGDLFIDIQQRELQKLGLGAEWLLGQGTIYPDTIESGGTGNSQVIKTHHNRVERIQKMLAQGLVIEPLVDLYKDEVRELGEILGLPGHMVWRHPFPGPGLAIRLLCSDGQETCDSFLQLAAEELLEGYPLRGIVLPIKSVGVQGDARTFAHPVLLISTIGVNPGWDLLAEVSTLITNRIPGINRVLYELATLSTPWKRPYTTRCSLTPNRIAGLQEIDRAITTFLRTHNLYNQVWQCPVVRIPCGPAPDTESIVLRPVDSTEAMTANFSQLPLNLVTNTVRGMLNSQVPSFLYDITNKPPGTIEWE